MLPGFWAFSGETLLNVSDPLALHKTGKNHPRLVASAEVTQHAVQPCPCPLPRCWRPATPGEDAASALLLGMLFRSFPLSSPNPCLAPALASPAACSPLAKPSWEPAKADFLPPVAIPLDTFDVSLPCPNPATRTRLVAGVQQVACPTLPGPEGAALRGPWRIYLKPGRVCRQYVGGMQSLRLGSQLPSGRSPCVRGGMSFSP